MSSCPTAEFGGYNRTSCPASAGPQRPWPPSVLVVRALQLLARPTAGGGAGRAQRQLLPRSAPSPTLCRSRASRLGQPWRSRSGQTISEGGRSQWPHHSVLYRRGDAQRTARASSLSGSAPLLIGSFAVCPRCAALLWALETQRDEARHLHLGAHVRGTVNRRSIMLSAKRNKCTYSIPI